MESVKTIWEYPLFSLGGGASIRVSQLVLVLLVLLIGYLVSRLAAGFLRRRLAKTELRRDASYLLEKIVF